MNRVDREIPESFTRRMLLAGSPVARFLVLLWIVLSSAAAQAQVVLKPTPRVVLGRSEAVQLEFLNPQGIAFALVTNAGSVAPPRRQADGSWTALYTPHSAFSPGGDRGCSGYGRQAFVVEFNSSLWGTRDSSQLGSQC